MALSALHEVAGGGRGAIDGPAATLFAAGITARTRGKGLWWITRLDLFAPALAQAGLVPDRVIYVEAVDEKSVLARMTASRRLQLAAENSGTTGIAIRRWRRPTEVADFGLPTASVTRWRVTVLLATPIAVAPQLLPH